MRSIRRRRAPASSDAIGSSCSSHARIPASATASAIAEADSFAASYLTWSRCAITSAENASTPASVLKRRSMSATSSRQSIPSTLKVDSACSSQTAQVAMRQVARPSAAALLHVLEPLLEQADDVLIVEGVVDRLAVAARPDQAHVAEEAQLVRDGRFGQAEQVGNLADAELGCGRSRRESGRG